jgi:hypothetical protein
MRNGLPEEAGGAVDVDGGVVEVDGNVVEVDEDVVNSRVRVTERGLLREGRHRGAPPPHPSDCSGRARAAVVIGVPVIDSLAARRTWPTPLGGGCSPVALRHHLSVVLL